MSADTRRHTFLIPAVAGLLIGVAGVAVAQQYPPSGSTVGVTDSTVRPGEDIVVSGDRWKPGTTVSLSFLSTPVALGSATVRADGTFSKTVTIPSSATPGTHYIVASGRARSGAHRTVRTAIRVLGVVTAGGTTAFTGAQLRVWMFLAISLFGVGLGLILISRRRRSSLLR